MTERRVVCTIGSGDHAELVDLSAETFAIYAARHGYDLEVRRTAIAPERPVAWSKIPLFLELFERFDLIVWIDADAAIVDPTLDIASGLAPTDLMGVVAHHYEGQVIPNCGVWLLRRDRRVEAFLRRLWRRTEYVSHRWWDNAAFLDELGYSVDPTVAPVRRTRMRRRVRFLDRAWNSIPADPAPEPRINHYPGQSHELRVAHLRRDLETARRRTVERVAVDADGSG